MFKRNFLTDFFMALHRAPFFAHPDALISLSSIPVSSEYTSKLGSMSLISSRYFNRFSSLLSA
jgi:hypothetical protein